jgi:hypothetical protein
MVARHWRRAARLSGADPEAVWQWAFTELVSTGLFLLRLGQHEEAGTFLTTAGKLTAATANGLPGQLRGDTRSRLRGPVPGRGRGRDRATRAQPDPARVVMARQLLKGRPDSRI